ncbi:MAG: 30S ribosomal protein S20, partial [Candidatus Dadabacteria bacterium]|nr:30S ribosomal protein S20 [Candidatus Dadabacteria bacterium]
KRLGRNRSARTSTRTTMANALEAIDGGDATEAELAVMAALSGLDRAVQKGVLHRNNASRRKSRLAIKMNRLLEAGPDAAPVQEPARGRQTRRRTTGSRSRG